MPHESENGGAADAALPRRRRALELLAYGIDRENRTLAAVRVKARGAIGSQVRPIGGRRGKIGDYTPASRARFRDAFLAVKPVLEPRRRGNRRHRPASFVTLTYPASWDPDPRTWKRHLDLWLQKLKRRYPAAWAIWALEFQRRRAPHFHLIVCWDGSRPNEKWQERRAWISASWAAVVGRGGSQPGHLGAGTQVRAVGSAPQVRRYVTKRETKDGGPADAGMRVRTIDSAPQVRRYILRRQDKGAVPEGFGRWWGIHNRKAYRAVAVRVEVQVSRELTAAIAVGIRNNWRRYLGGAVESYKLPRWVDGHTANDVLRAAGALDEVFDADWVDLGSGEVAADKDAGGASVRDEAPPAGGPPSQSSRPARPVPESPGIMRCERCGRPRNRLAEGLCRVCQGI